MSWQAQHGSAGVLLAGLQLCCARPDAQCCSAAFACLDFTALQAHCLVWFLQERCFLRASVQLCESLAAVQVTERVSQLFQNEEVDRWRLRMFVTGERVCKQRPCNVSWLPQQPASVCRQRHCSSTKQRR